MTEYKQDCIEYVIKGGSPFCCLFGIFIDCENCRNYVDEKE